MALAMSFLTRQGLFVSFLPVFWCMLTAVEIPQLLAYSVLVLSLTHSGHTWLEGVAESFRHLSLNSVARGWKCCSGIERFRILPIWIFVFGCLVFGLMMTTVLIFRLGNVPLVALNDVAIFVVAIFGIGLCAMLTLGCVDRITKAN